MRPTHPSDRAARLRAATAKKLEMCQELRETARRLRDETAAIRRRSTLLRDRAFVLRLQRGARWPFGEARRPPPSFNPERSN